MGRPTRENFCTCSLQITYHWQHLNVKMPSCRQVLFNREFTVYVFMGFSSSETEDFDTLEGNVFKPQISAWQTSKTGITIPPSIGTYVVWERNNFLYREATRMSYLRVTRKCSACLSECHSNSLKLGWLAVFYLKSGDLFY